MASKGRHALPTDHHIAKAVLGTSTIAAIGIGGLVGLTKPRPLPTSSPFTTQSPVRVATTLVPKADVVPAPTYTVVPGDILGRIAGRIGEPTQALYNDNVSVIGADPDLIFPGQVLMVSATASAPAPPPAPVPAAVPAHSAAQAAVDLAGQELGNPYVWAAAGPSAFDCSGLVQFVYSQLGVDLPHSSAMQSTIGERVGSLDQAEPGDLLFFYSPVGHVGIYVGNGQMIAAPEPGDVVKQQAVWATPTVIRRVL